MPPDGPAPWSRASYTIGIPLASALALLRVSWAVLPELFRGRGEYALGVHDPALWSRLHAYLLVGGTIPGCLGLLGGLRCLRSDPSDGWAWVGAVTNGAFVLVALDLYLALARQGYFSFVLSALPRFLDV